jgi:hypothetical protein
MSLVTIATAATDLIIEDLQSSLPTRTEVHGTYFWGVTQTYGVQFATYFGEIGNETGIIVQSLPMFNTEDEAYAAGATALDTLEADGVMPDWCSAGT